MITANIHHAKTHLSKLIEKALEGEEIVISKAGKPLVKLTPVTHLNKERVPGSWKGKVWMADDFDTLPDDIQKFFDGDA